MQNQCNELQGKMADVLAGKEIALEPEIFERHLLECSGCLQSLQDLLEDDPLMTGFVQSVDRRLTLLEDKIMESLDPRMAAPRALPRWED